MSTREENYRNPINLFFFFSFPLFLRPNQSSLCAATQPSQSTSTITISSLAHPQPLLLPPCLLHKIASTPSDAAHAGQTERYPWPLLISQSLPSTLSGRANHVVAMQGLHHRSSHHIASSARARAHVAVHSASTRPCYCCHCCCHLRAHRSFGYKAIPEPPLPLFSSPHLQQKENLKGA